MVKERKDMNEYEKLSSDLSWVGMKAYEGCFGDAEAVIINNTINQALEAVTRLERYERLEKRIREICSNPATDHDTARLILDNLECRGSTSKESDKCKL